MGRVPDSTLVYWARTTDQRLQRYALNTMTPEQFRALAKELLDLRIRRSNCLCRKKRGTDAKGAK